MLKKYLNANDLNCPLPLLNTKLSLSELNSGEILEITAKTLLHGKILLLLPPVFMRQPPSWPE